MINVILNFLSVVICRLGKPISLWSVIIFFSVKASFAQLQAGRHKTIPYQGDTVFADSLSILPGSLEVFCDGAKLPSSDYSYDWITSRIFFSRMLDCDSILLVYKTVPFRVPRSYYNKPPSLMNKGTINFLNPFESTRNQDDSSDDSGIETNGALSRGIQLGNAQNVSVNSALNLQVTGKINDRISVAGMVSDNNVPVQPGGDTRQAEDFDRIFIQLFDEKNKLTAGDFQLKKPSGYFLNYFKRAQGALFQHGEADGNSDFVEASASVSKGRFGRNVIQGIEGNQGPYRLTGSEGETFIVILAGTELVYIDGRLLQRGQDADYVMDYNSAEISFTPRQFITKDRRIVVEFQYSDRRYARPLLTASVFMGTKDNHVYVNVFSEHDAKNQPLQQELTDDDKILLAGSGDNLLGAARSGISTGDFDYNRVMYVLTDSLGFDSVLVYSNDTATAKTTATFSFVGNGQGDYVEDGFTPAGKKYRWIAPLVSGDDTVHYGSYSPVYILFAPTQQQMVSCGGRWDKGRKVSLSAEGAVSHKDINSFSSKDNSDNVGSAFRARIQLGDTSSFSRMHFIADGSYEYVNRRFIQVERFREVEFTRNWNLPSGGILADQHWLRFEPGINFRRTGQVKVALDFLDANGWQRGRKISSFVNLARKDNWKIQGNGSYLSTTGERSSEFIRHKSEWTKFNGPVSLVFKDEHEWNQRFIEASPRLSSESYRFYDWEGSLGTIDTMARALRLHYRQRYEQRADSLALIPASRAEQYGLQSRYQWNEGNHVGATVSNRRLKIIRTDLLSAQPENTLVGRFDNSVRLLKGGLVGSSFYEVGSGLEQRRTFFYSEVAPGQGTHIWVDYNGDGLRDLNEFEVAPFDYEANFIRVSVPGNDYVKTFTNVFNQSVQLNLGRITGDSGKVRRFLGRWSDAALWRQERKTASSNRQAQLDPLYDWKLDTALMTVSGVLRNVVFFNRSSPKFASDYTFQKTSRRELLQGGSNIAEETQKSIQCRYTFLGQLTWFNSFYRNEKSQQSEILEGRNYDLINKGVESRFLWQKTADKSIELHCKYFFKQELSGIASGDLRELGLILTSNSIDKSSISVTVDYIIIRLNGPTNSPVSFEILEGLNLGDNITWNISWQQSVAKNLQLNLSYQGRDSADTRAIHVASVQLRATF
jgi:hypothetical protein